MSWYSWFSHPVTYRTHATIEDAGPTEEEEKGVAEGAGARAKPKPKPPEEKIEVGNVGSLVSSDSLVTFGGGTIGITVIWKTIELLTGYPHSLWLGFIISVAVGACLFGGDAVQKPKPPHPPLRLRILAAVVNTCVLFGAANSALTVKDVALGEKPGVSAQSGPGSK